MAMLLNKAVLHDIILPAPGLIKLIAELRIAELLPTSYSVIIKKTFFLLKLLYFCLEDSLSLLRLFNILS